MKQVIWTCDRCKYYEKSAEHVSPKDRDFYMVGVVVHKLPVGLKAKTSPEALWCANCCAAMKVLPVKINVGEEKPPPPTIDELVYEIACGALENARP